MRPPSNPAAGAAALAVAAVLLFLAPAGAAPAASSRVLLPDSIKEIPASAPLERPHRVRDQLRQDELARPMGFVVSLRLRNYAELERRVQAGQRIPQAELEARYLPLPSDYARVGAWMKAQGLELTGLGDRNHTNVFARGPVARVAAALGVTFARVATADGEFTSAVNAPSLPADLAPAVLGIDGLQPHLRMHVPRPRVDTVTNVAGIVAPADILAAYNVPGTLTGSGQTIAIIMSAAPATGDLTAFWTAVGINRGAATYTLINVNDGSNTGPTGPSQTDAAPEVTMDTEWSTGIAPAASVRVYATPDLSYYDLQVACEDVISDGLASVASYSASGPEEGDTLGSLMGNSQEFALMAAAGITMLSSSGDSGSNPNTSGTNGYASSNLLSAMYPASDPNLAGIGGTTPTFDINWNMTSEAAWSEIGIVTTNPNATGGGVSTVFTKPSWQTGGTLLASETMRCVPDVSAMSTAVATNGGGTYGTAGFVYLNGGDAAIGGTSLASPIWAGLTADVNQARIATGRATLGLLGPNVYPYLGTSAFNDVTAGSNGAYSAATGYDLCTGIGTPNIGNLVLHLAPVAPVDNTSTGSGALGANIDGSYNTANGYSALFANLSGSQNTATGFKAAYADVGGSENTAYGVQALLFNTSGADNTAAGSAALYTNTTGLYGSAFGYGALYSNTTGGDNTAMGFRALLDTTTGTLNTGDGVQALASNSTGDYNAAVGAKALYSGTAASHNTATGYATLYFAAGGDNTADGYDALLHTTTGTENTAVGSQAAFTDTADGGTTAVGFQALNANSGGSQNSAFGAQVLAGNTSAAGSTGVGYQALYADTTAPYQTAMGYQALYAAGSAGFNLADGSQALAATTSGSEDVALGAGALATNTVGSVDIAIGQGAGSAVSADYYTIDIGNPGSASVNYAIAVGSGQTQAFIAGIAGATAAGGSAVYVDPSSGQLGTLTSSQRFKADIQDMGTASAAVLALRPVAFRYRPELDPKGTPQFGLIAEEVERVAPDLVLYDAGQRPFAVRYEAVNAMLLNEFRREHGRVEEQARTLADAERRARDEEAEIVAHRERIAALAAAQPDVAARQRAIDALRARLNALEAAAAQGR